jgi:heat shock protein HslJ
MACLEGMDQEQQFLYLLTVAMRYSIISSDNLPLYSGDERLVLRFKAIALQ